MMAAMQNGGGVVEVLSTRLRSLRRARGWSQEELADRADLEQTQISSWERGSRKPSMESVAKLARAFEIPHEQLAREFGYLTPADVDVTPGDLPAWIVALMREMVRQHPELAPQFEKYAGDPDLFGQVVELARVLGYTVKGFLDEHEG